MLPRPLVLAAYRTQADKMKKEVADWDEKVKVLPDSAQRIWRRHMNEVHAKEDRFEDDFRWLLSTPETDNKLWTKRRHDLSRAFIEWRQAVVTSIGLIRYRRSKKEQGFTFP